MEEAIRSLLMAKTAISAVVGTRIDWGVRPQGSALPAIIINGISGVPQIPLMMIAGMWTKSRIQIECWARTALVCRNLADAIGGPFGLFTGYRGDHCKTRLRTFIVDRRSDQDSDAQGALHRTMLDAMVWHLPLPVPEPTP